MRKAALFPALLICLLSSSAHAVVMDLFTVTGPGVNISYSEPAGFTTPDFSLWDAYFTGVSATVNGTPNQNINIEYSTVIFPQISVNYGNLPITGIPALTLTGPDLFTWTTVPDSSNVSPYLPYDIVGTFTLGTFTEHTLTGGTAYTITISQEPGSVTPEPSSLILLGTGVIAAAGTQLSRRRARS